MESTSGFIELKIISGKSLRGFNFFQKLTVYALVYITSDDGKQLQNQKTPTDRDGDGNPEWNHTVRLEISDDLFRDRNRLYIHFELFHEGAMFGDKPIGEVIVPLVDLIRESSDGVVRFVTYQVRTRDGKSNGELNFSFKVEIEKDLKMESPSLSPACFISGYPVFHKPELEFCCSSEVESGSPRVQYPVLDLEYMFVHGPNLVQETNHFQPQDNGFYHHQRPPPPAAPLPYPPPPTTVEHGGDYYYHHPPPPPAAPLQYPPPPATAEHGGDYYYHHPPPPPSPGYNLNGSVHGYYTHSGSQVGSGEVVQLETTGSNGWQGVGLGGNFHHSTSGNGW